MKIAIETRSSCPQIKSQGGKILLGIFEADSWDEAYKLYRKEGGADLLPYEVLFTNLISEEEAITLRSWAHIKNCDSVIDRKLRTDKEFIGFYKNLLNFLKKELAGIRDDEDQISLEEAIDLLKSALGISWIDVASDLGDKQ